MSTKPESRTRRRGIMFGLLFTLTAIASFALIACAGERIVEVTVQTEIIRTVEVEVPVEVEREVVREVEIEVPVEVEKEVVREVEKEVPVEIVREVVRTVEVEKQVAVEVEVEKVVEKEVQVRVEVTREVEVEVEKVVEKEVVKEVEKQVQVQVVVTATPVLATYGYSCSCRDQCSAFSTSPWRIDLGDRRQPTQLVRLQRRKPVLWR